VMNLPLAGLFARLLQIRYSWIYPPILAICLTGVMSHANNVEDAWLMLAFGVLGWLMKRYDWSAAPMILGLVLGPIFENSLRQSLTLSHGSGTIFFTRPLAAVLLLLALLAVTTPLWSRIFNAKTA
jgi:putative tricarboxylic transport membrane protein